MQRNTNAATLAPPQASSRMVLTAVSRGRQRNRPLRVLLYSAEGLGKSTFASGAPNPVFLDVEDGTSQLDVARFPQPQGWGDILDAVRVLTEEPHDFQTLCIDTLDAAEPFVWQHVCAAAGVRTIEEVGGGFGKGYVAAIGEWLRLQAALEALQQRREMHVILLAHAQVRAFRDPAGDAYDRYTLRLNEKAAGVMKEWCDDVLFGTLEVLTAQDQRTKRVRGVTTGARLVHTVRTAAWDAKTRHGLPETLPLSWDEFAAALELDAPAEPDALIAAIQTNAGQLDEALRARAVDALAKAGRDVRRLLELNNRISARLAEKVEE